MHRQIHAWIICLCHIDFDVVHALLKERGPFTRAWYRGGHLITLLSVGNNSTGHASHGLICGLSVVKLQVVVVEVTLRGKGLLAPLVLAVVRFLACVQPQVGFKITLLVKCLPAPGVGALEVALSLVLVHVHLETLDARITLVTVFVRALVETLLHVRVLVVAHVALAHKGLGAAGIVACKGLCVALRICQAKILRGFAGA